MTRITTGSDCVTLINTFFVAPDNADRLVALLETATNEVMKAQPGFISANLHKSLDGKRVLNYAQWRSAEDFQAMLKNPQAQAHMAPIGKFASFDAHLYSVVDVHHA